MDESPWEVGIEDERARLLICPKATSLNPSSSGLEIRIGVKVMIYLSASKLVVQFYVFSKASSQ
jgi:hypothetical protein